MTYEELINNPDYEKLDCFSHKNIKHVVMKEMGDGGSWASVSNIYQSIGLIAILYGAFRALFPFFKYGKLDNLVGLAGGVLFSVTLLIVLHELIHAFAYKLIGAKKLSFGMRVRKFLFFVLADRQVFCFQQFRKVALAPVVTIGALCITGMVFTFNQPMFYFFLSVFGIHSLFSGGDFGLLSYFENRKEKEILTFDVKEEGKTYFYVKKEKE